MIPGFKEFIENYQAIQEAFLKGFILGKGITLKTFYKYGKLIPDINGKTIFYWKDKKIQTFELTFTTEE